MLTIRGSFLENSPSDFSDQPKRRFTFLVFTVSQPTLLDHQYYITFPMFLSTIKYDKMRFRQLYSLHKTYNTVERPRRFDKKCCRRHRREKSCAKRTWRSGACCQDTYPTAMLCGIFCGERSFFPSLNPRVCAEPAVQRRGARGHL